MHRSITALLMAAFVSAGCHHALESAGNHIVHVGETAVVETGRPTVLVATSQGHMHELAPAVSANDQTILDRLVRDGKAFEIPAGTIVKVEHQSFDERRIRVLNGPAKGRVAWVQFESLKPYREPR